MARQGHIGLVGAMSEPLEDGDEEDSDEIKMGFEETFLLFKNVCIDKLYNNFIIVTQNKMNSRTHITPFKNSLKPSTRCLMF